MVWWSEALGRWWDQEGGAPIDEIRALSYHSLDHTGSLIWKHKEEESKNYILLNWVCVCVCVCLCSVASVVFNFLGSHGPGSTRLLSPWHSPGKNTGVGCHALLQGIFPTRGLNLSLLCLLHCRQILYHSAPGEALSLCNGSQFFYL